MQVNRVNQQTNFKGVYVKAPKLSGLPQQWLDISHGLTTTVAPHAVNRAFKRSVEEGLALKIQGASSINSIGKIDNDKVDFDIVLTGRNAAAFRHSVSPKRYLGQACKPAWSIHLGPKSTITQIDGASFKA